MILNIVTGILAAGFGLWVGVAWQHSAALGGVIVLWALAAAVVGALVMILRRRFRVRGPR